MYMANIREQMMFNLVVQPTDKPGEYPAFRRIIGRSI